MALNKERGSLMELYPGLPSYCLIHPFSVIITEFRNKRLKKRINSKYVLVDKKTGLKIWHPWIKLDNLSRNRQGYYCRVFYSHSGMLFF